MAFIVQENEINYMCFFQELQSDTFRFIITNLVDFYTEELTRDQLHHRMSEELNRKLKISPKAIIQTLQTQPESCAIEQNEDVLRIRLKFLLKLKIPALWEAEFNTKKSSSNLSHSFILQLMKMTIDDKLKIDKMKKALEAKDEEIEEYKRNGGTLLRGKC